MLRAVVKVSAVMGLWACQQEAAVLDGKTACCAVVRRSTWGNLSRNAPFANAVAVTSGVKGFSLAVIFTSVPVTYTGRNTFSLWKHRAKIKMEKTTAGIWGRSG